MSSNHPYTHSLPYREAQGCFKTSEGGLTTRTYALEAGSVNVRLAAASGQPCIRPYVVTVVSGQPEGRWTLGGEKKKGMVSTFAWCQEKCWKT